VCRMELLRGPLYYVLVLIAATLVFWRESPVRPARLVSAAAADGCQGGAGAHVCRPGCRWAWWPSR